MAPAKKKARVDPPAAPVVASDDPSVGFIRFEAALCDITIDGVRSPDIEVYGMPWHLLVRNEVTNSYLGVYLNHRESDSTIWSVDVDIQFILENADESKNVVFKFTKTFNHTFLAWGYPQFLTWKDVIDVNKGFVRDGKISIKAQFSLTNTVGVRMRPRIDFSDPDDPRHDIALVIEGQKIHVNKAVLSVHSPVFHAMFNGQFAEKNKKEVELKDIGHQEFIEMLNLIYPSYEKITDAKAESLLRIADRFQITSIIDQVELFLIASTKMNICSKLKLSDKYRLVNLQDHCLDSLKTVKNITDLKTADGYNDLSNGVHATLMKKIMKLS